ncbi:hypothetical protein BCR32DRAFT_296060 [Anaeromyces robustus]|jgi:hypothetical protein|uniref:PH domain-containing protein n=1 Tax=Anaeromyces robustus TaxID=1754192 RepID=A0A1Y1WT89_9FUNG|nr:hypothetical protein BCR32DRAFT_296060 [Anaeromyces robustus]|eukprot:ORX76743.1 hypothetical protein BCR32DRAFT_296060 [Anaeromyces robustus]
MPSKTKVRHRVTFAPDTKTETEQLDCLVRAIEFKGPGIDELSNMIQNIHMGYTANKRKPSFDSTSIIEQLRNTLDTMLDSEFAETCIKTTDDTKASSVDNVENIKELKAKNHDSGISDIEFDLEKIKNNEVSPQARRRVSGLINKLDTCITELQRVTDTIEEETTSEVQALEEENNEIPKSGKEALPPKNGKPVQLSIDTNINRNNVNNDANVNTENALYCEPASASDYYTANANDYLYSYDNVNEMSKFELMKKGIYAIPNQPTVIEACYSGFLLSSILTVVSDECSVLYFGILTENSLYFYNSTEDDEPMFGRIIIDQNTKVLPITNLENQEYLIEINGVYVMPDNQVINSKVRIKFNSKQERNIWYKVIRTTINDWKIKTSYVENQTQAKPNGRKRRLSFLSSIQLQPLYLSKTPSRSDSLHRKGPSKPVTKHTSEMSEATVVSPDSANTVTNTNDNQIYTSSSPTSATTITSEEEYSGVNPSQSILSALHVLEALERKRTNQELKNKSD